MGMTQAQLLALINANVPDNVSKQITPTKMREVLTQLAVSPVLLDAALAQVVTDDVNFTGELTKNGVNLITNAKEVEVLRAFSAVDQAPTALGTALQLTHGAAQKTVSDPVMLSAAGVVTFNQTGFYDIRVKLQFGRTGATGTSELMSRIMLNGTQLGVSASAKIDSPNLVIPTDSRVVLGQVAAGSVLTVEIIRDSSGANAGGVYAKTSAHGWNVSPSTLIVVSRLEGIS